MIFLSRFVLITGRKPSLRRLCFYTCLSVILFTRGGSTWAGTPRTRYTPQDRVHPHLGLGTPPGQVHPLDQVHLPWDQVHPPPVQVHPHEPGTPPSWAGTPPRTRYTPPGPSTHPPGPGTPPRTRYTPWAGTPPRTRYTPQDQVHPPWDQVHPPGTRYTPPGPGTPPRPGTPPSSACWEIWATSGRYASYWNAFLLRTVM